MRLCSTRNQPLLDWAWAGAAFEGAMDSGDLQVLIPLPDGALLAVIDGLGHGWEAAQAAREAASILTDHANLTIPELLDVCNEGLRKTRGVCMSLLALDVPSASLAWFGIGNVEAVLLGTDRAGQRRQEAIGLRGGVVGYRMPPINVRRVPIFAGDLLVMATDGLRSEFSREIALEWEPQAIADWLLLHYGKGTDDALVLVARYLGGSP